MCNKNVTIFKSNLNSQVFMNSEFRPEWILGIHENKPEGEIYFTANFAYHPYFDYPYDHYPLFDLALVTLHRKIDFSFRVAPICMPKEGQTFYGQKVIAAGW